jgi:hypothetical protein
MGVGDASKSISPLFASECVSPKAGFSLSLSPPPPSLPLGKTHRMREDLAHERCCRTSYPPSFGLKNLILLTNESFCIHPCSSWIRDRCWLARCCARGWYQDHHALQCTPTNHIHYSSGPSASTTGCVQCSLFDKDFALEDAIGSHTV